MSDSDSGESQACQNSFYQILNKKAQPFFFVKEFTSFGFELKFGFSENKDGIFVFTNFLKLGAFESENVTNLLFNVVRGS